MTNVQKIFTSLFFLSLFIIGDKSFILFGSNNEAVWYIVLVGIVVVSWEAVARDSLIKLYLSI